jgi:hypothetical protein
MLAKHLIYLSATPTPESFVQIFQQLHLWKNSPFKDYKNFYKWHKDYGIPEKKYIGAQQVNDYSKAKDEKILSEIDHLFVRYTQKMAGFTHEIKEIFIDVKMNESTYRVIEKLKRDRIIQGNRGEIVADTGGKLCQKVHQLCSGTVKLEHGEGVIIDRSKAEYIKTISGKIAVYYKFKMEGELLKQTFGDRITEDPEEFQKSEGLIFISQVISGREGVTIDTADKLIMFNVDHAYLSYRQTMDRIQAYKLEKEPELIWLFSEKGCERRIYDIVKNEKTNFTYAHFKRMEKAEKQTRLSL